MRRAFAGTLAGLFLTLALLVCLPGRAFAADASVRSVSYAAYLAPDGSASVTEEWTVDFGAQPAEPFERKLTFDGDALHRSAAVSPASVTLDGAVLEREDGTDARDGTWSDLSGSGFMRVRVNRRLSGSHTFSFRYDVYGCVKVYNGHAVCFLRVRDDDAPSVIQEVLCSILLPQECAPRAVRVLESADLPAEKNRRGAAFRGVDVVGGVMLGIQTPVDLFDRTPLTTVEDDDTVATVLRAVFIALGVLALAALAAVLANSKKLYLRACRKRALSHASREADPAFYDGVLARISPAQVLAVTGTRTFSGADPFVVTALDLIRRGYLVPEGADFVYRGASDRDDVRRPPEKHERESIRLFTSGQWKRLVKNPDEFAQYLRRFDRMIPGVKPLDPFRADRRRLHEDCFRLLAGASYRERVRPADVSDAIFRSDRYDAADLLFALVNESKRAKTYVSPDGLKDFFSFRNILESASLPSRKGSARKQNGGNAK